VLWFAGGVIDWDNMYAFHRGVDDVDKGQYDSMYDTDFITGCSMFIKSEVFEKVGLLDEKFFMYLEDVDFCLRARKKGYRLLYIPKSVIWHKNAGSTGRPGHDLHDYYFTRNRLLLGVRYAPLRTKFALFRESIKYLMKGPDIRKNAVADAYLGHFGSGYIWKKS
jgi:hypothetical protein